jgi:hypothetical protein
MPVYVAVHTDLFFLDRIYRIDGIFFACGERPFGRKTDGRWKIAPLG